MAEDEEYESFDFNDRDLDFALNRGPRRRQTKEQQIYGVWAEEEDEDERPGFGRQKGRSNGPVAFVSGGVAVGNKIEEEVVIIEEKKAGPSNLNDEIEVSMLPATKRKKFDSQFTTQNNQKAFAGIRSTPMSSGQSDAWISPKIANMMKKMGHVSGQGLGKNKQGIVEPVQAILRPGRGAVGAYGNETKGLKFGESAGDAQRNTDGSNDVVEIRTEEAKNNAWKKSHAKKVKPRYVTLDEVVKERTDYDQISTAAKQSAVKFIDMTGPEHKVYDSIHSFQQRSELDKPQRRPNFDVPALTDNIDQLLLSCKDEIRRNNDHLQELKSKTGGLERNKTEMEAYVRDTREDVEKMEHVMRIVKQFESSRNLNLYKDLFCLLKSKYAAEYKLYGLDSLVDFKVAPLVEHFRSWNPLENVDFGLKEMTEWRNLLVGENQVFSNQLNVFDSLLWIAWMPSIRRCVLDWDPRTDWDKQTDRRRMIDLIATWSPLLPSWIQDDLFDNVIVPRIRLKVDEWDPIEDQIPIDEWVVPWYKILADRLVGIFPQIRQKLSKALRMWKPTDESAIPVIKPWKNVFTRATMQGFLAANIVPKLEKMLSQMDMNPNTNPTHSEFNAVLAWEDLLGSEIVAQILTRNFFPRWYENFCLWLETENMKMDEVIQYYKYWKGQTSTLEHLEPIKGKCTTSSILTDSLAEFIRAMKAIQQVKSSVMVTRMPNYEQTRVSLPPPVQQPQVPTYQAMPFQQTSFRHFVQQQAQQRGIPFAPTNRNYHGRAIYSFNDRSVYFDGTLIFIFDSTTSKWQPIGLEQLIPSM
ncbi:Septin and tuftelin-interacting protein 1-like protein [Aphelenchoides besseyi]|nr:Septin and tuftelin-interacting protein 1-like protein [Aphelenchoides besseyi]